MGVITAIPKNRISEALVFMNVLSGGNGDRCDFMRNTNSKLLSPFNTLMERNA